MKASKNPDREPRPTQETPAGATVPIPSEEEFFRDLARAAKPRKKLPKRGSEDKRK